MTFVSYSPYRAEKKVLLLLSLWSVSSKKAFLSQFLDLEKQSKHFSWFSKPYLCNVFYELGITYLINNCFNQGSNPELRGLQSIPKRWGQIPIPDSTPMNNSGLWQNILLFKLHSKFSAFGKGQTHKFPLKFTTQFLKLGLVWKL